MQTSGQPSTVIDGVHWGVLRVADFKLLLFFVQGVWSEVYGLPLGTAVAAAAAGSGDSSSEQQDQQQ